MKRVSCIPFVFLVLAATSVHAQELDKYFVKGLRFDLSPFTSLPEAYKTYHIDFDVDALEPYMTGSPLAKNHFTLFKEDFKESKLLPTLKVVKQDGDFYFRVHAGEFKVHATDNVLRPKKTNVDFNGYVKKIDYSFSFSVALCNKDGSVIRELLQKSDSVFSSYVYTPNFRNIRGSSSWNADEVFNSEKELEAKFMEEQKWVYDERITDDIRNLLIRVRDEVLTPLYIGYKKVSYSPRFYTAKVKGRQFDYSDLDTAYAAYTLAFEKLKANAGNRGAYEGDFKKALKICIDAYNNAGPRMNFELKNGLLYNIATMYYHLGNPEEARKYVAMYKVDSWDYISNTNPRFRPEYEKHDIHFVLYEAFWGGERKLIL